MHEKWTKLCTASNYYYRRLEGISLQIDRGWKVLAVKASAIARLPQCPTLLRGLRSIFTNRTIKFYVANRYSRTSARRIINFYFGFWNPDDPDDFLARLTYHTLTRTLFHMQKRLSISQFPTNSATMTNFLKLIFSTRRIIYNIYILHFRFDKLILSSKNHVLIIFYLNEIAFRAFNASI